MTIQMTAIGQDQPEQAKIHSWWSNHPVLENLAFQHEQRALRSYYGGIGLGSFTVGYHYKEKWGVSFYYHPYNQFEQGDPVGLGFGEGTAGKQYRNARIYGQTGLEGYENLDRHTLVAGVRYYVLSSFFVGTGLALQVGSSREVNFLSQDRQVGNSMYNNLGIHVTTSLKNQFTPYLALGFHHQIGRMGLFAEGNFGFGNKRLKHSTISFTQEIAESDRQQFLGEVQRGARSEGFGIATAGLSFSF